MDKELKITSHLVKTELPVKTKVLLLPLSKK